MCDISDSDRCLSKIEPRLKELSEKYPGGGVYAYPGGHGKVFASAKTSYREAEICFLRLTEGQRNRGVLLQLLDKQMALVL